MRTVMMKGYGEIVIIVYFVVADYCYVLDTR